MPRLKGKQRTNQSKKTTSDSNKEISGASEPAPPPVHHAPAYSLEEIQGYFWPDDNDARKPVSNPAQPKALHDSADRPGQLAYVLLYQRANPSWEPTQTIYATTSWELLPGIPDRRQYDGVMEGLSTEAIEKFATAARNDFVQNIRTASPNPFVPRNQPKQHKGVAVFTQRSDKKDGCFFVFDGRYEIRGVTVLSTKDETLYRTVEEEWAREGRLGAKTTLDDDTAGGPCLPWAVVKFRRDEAAQKKHGNPKVEKQPDSESDGTGETEDSVETGIAVSGLRHGLLSGSLNSKVICLI